MMPKLFGRLFVAALACSLLGGCRSDFHLLLFNGTTDTVVLSNREADRSPRVVVAGISGEITGVSTDDFTIERKGKTLHYHFPRGYTVPSASVPSGYERNVPKVGRSFYFQLGNDNRISILRRREALTSISHPAQPAGFPLVPY